MRMTPAVKVILIINVVFYLLAEWITPMFALNGHSDWFSNFNALYPIGSEAFAPYQLITYMFMHAGWWHLFFNMWSLMIFGNAVEQQIGTKRFWAYYMTCGVGSALVNQLISFIGIIPPTALVGASGAIYGVMAAAAFYFPNAKLFIIPIPFPIKLKYLVLFYTIAEMFMGVTSVDGVAHFAHLGGLAVGIVYLLILRAVDKNKAKRSGDGYWTTSTSYDSYDKGEGFSSKLKSMFGGGKKPRMRVTTLNDNNPADHEYNAKKTVDNEEIDRILDKIRKSGYNNLTAEEKAKLFDASKRMKDE